MLELPDYLLREACIPAGAKLCAYADDEEQTVTIGVAEYDHDLRDVPPYLLDIRFHPLYRAEARCRPSDRLSDSKRPDTVFRYCPRGKSHAG